MSDTVERALVSELSNSFSQLQQTLSGNGQLESEPQFYGVLHLMWVWFLCYSPRLPVKILC